jgi:hypothetical protein
MAIFCYGGLNTQFFDLLVLEAIHFYFVIAVFSLLMMRGRRFGFAS